jgi:inhibitor of KinA sporulation pathway (predicted exonuclease)
MSLLFIDLEMAEEGQKEIIQIGIIEVSWENEIKREASFFCKPKNSKLTERITQLTGITEADLKKARPIEEVIRTVSKQFSFKNNTVIGWGEDAKILIEELKAKGIEFEIPTYVNLAATYKVLMGSKSKISLEEALKNLGYGEVEIKHNAVEDAKDLFKTFLALQVKIKND